MKKSVTHEYKFGSSFVNEKKTKGKWFQGAKCRWGRLGYLRLMVPTTTHAHYTKHQLVPTTTHAHYTQHRKVPSTTYTLHKATNCYEWQ